MPHALASEAASSRVALIERNGREYLVTMPGGTVFVALTLAEAEAMLSLWRLRSAPSHDRHGTLR